MTGTLFSVHACQHLKLDEGGPNAADQIEIGPRLHWALSFGYMYLALCPLPAMKRKSAPDPEDGPDVESSMSPSLSQRKKVRWESKLRVTQTTSDESSDEESENSASFEKGSQLFIISSSPSAYCGV